MATFEYQARDKSGEVRSGIIDASSQEGALDALHQTGLIVTSIQEQPKPFLTRISLGGRVKQKDLVIFSRQLATLFEAQIPIVQALKALVVETGKKALQKAIAEILDDITGGLSLSQAMAKHPRIFSSFYISLIRSGEESGKLQEVFTYLADYLERSYYLANKARNALVYPAFVLTVFILVFVLMLVVVIPRLSGIFEEAGVALPIYTQIVLFISLFLRKFGFFLLLLILIGAVLGWRWGKTPDGKIFFHRIQLNTPFIGGLWRKLYMARLTDNLRTLIIGGVPILKALAITGDVVGNEIYRQAINGAIDSVKGGNTISAAFERVPEIPPLVTAMMRIGELSGRLDFILASIGKFYQKEVDAAVESLVALIEPLLIVLLGGGVALLVASIMIPIYTLVGNL